MKKIIALLILAAWMLAGCGGRMAAETEPPTQTAVGAMEVPFETKPDLRKYLGTQLQFYSLLSGDAPEADALNQAAAFFEAQTGAEVSFRWFGGDGQALAAAMEETGAADIFEIAGGELASRKNDAMDLAELAAAADYESHSYAPLRQQVLQRCGYLAGIPIRPYLTGVYYNRDAFAACGIEKTPESWEDFLDVCGRLAESGWAPLTMDNENAWIPLALHLKRNLDADRADALISGGWEKDAGELMSQLAGLVQSGFLMDGCPMEYPAGQNKIALSNAVMAAGSNRLCGQVEQATLINISWGVFAWPGSGDGAGTAVDADVLAVCRTTPNAQAAFDFILLLATGEFDQLRADLSGGIPADPANESAISGACGLLAASDGRSLAPVAAPDNSRILKLWQGKLTP